ncbi:putative RNA-binding protein EEED8.10 isoform X2 [Varroa jacobsoni]|uniref:putative RNA-binding protein EEED8.10 isoform X2 n=1 Tax=Varroa jacobsoni TaxID=62625 RepID=UPI000BF92DBB|nr:putative RNA-binding protein EEED8.10 isoform X2 [Varroa jacobsoni]
MRNNSADQSTEKLIYEKTLRRKAGLLRARARSETGLEEIGAFSPAQLSLALTQLGGGAALAGTDVAALKFPLCPPNGDATLENKQGREMYSYAYRLRYLQKLHQDAFLGLNAVLLGEGLPPGAVYRSSLPATPVSTPIRENWVFSEQALRERLCKTPSPRKCRLFDPRRRSEAGLHEERENSWTEGEDNDDGEIDSPNEDADSVRENDDFMLLNRELFIGNISSKTTKSDLRELFTQFGRVTDVTICVDAERRWSRGFGFVTFSKKEEADRALEAGRQGIIMCDGRALRILPASDKRTFKLRQLAAKERRLKDEIDGIDESLDDDSIYVPVMSVENLNQMPDEVMSAILARLDWRARVRMERVCKRWQRLALKLWGAEEDIGFALKSFTTKQPLTIDIFRALLTRCKNSLRRVDLSMVNHTMAGGEAAEQVAQTCPHLEQLNMSGLPLSNVSLQQVAQKCPNLRKVELAGCRDIGEKGLWWLFHLCKHLEHIDLSGVSKLTGQCFHMSSQRLRCVILDACVGVTHSGFVKLATKCSFLQSLSLNSVTQLSDKDLNYICSNLRAIKIIKLEGKGLKNLTSTGLCTALQKLQQLEEAYLAENAEVTDDVVCVLARACTRLRILDISRCHRLTNLAFSALSQCLNLTTLRASYLNKVNDAGLCALSTQGALECFEVRGCPMITDEGLITLVSLCPTLTKVDISGCRRVTNHFVDEAVKLLNTRPTSSPLLKQTSHIESDKAGTAEQEPKSVLELELTTGSSGVSYAKTPSVRLVLDISTTCVLDWIPLESSKDSKGVEILEADNEVSAE